MSAAKRRKLAGNMDNSTLKQEQDVLTNDAYLARKWRSLPTLRHLLEGRRDPDYVRRTSLDQTAIERLGEVAGIAHLLIAHNDAVMNQATCESRAEVHAEIEKLANELQDFSRYLSELSGKVRRVHDLVESAERWR